MFGLWRDEDRQCFEGLGKTVFGGMRIDSDWSYEDRQCLEG